MHMPPLPQLTAWLLFITIVIIGGYDLWVSQHNSHGGTVSEYVYTVSRDYPVLPLIAGVVLGHLFWPQLPGPKL